MEILRRGNLMPIRGPIGCRPSLIGSCCRLHFRQMFDQRCAVARPPALALASYGSLRNVCIRGGTVGDGRLSCGEVWYDCGVVLVSYPPCLSSSPAVATQAGEGNAGA